MLVKNASPVTVYLDCLGMPGVSVAPGDTIELPDHFCVAHRKPNGSRKASDIERCAPQLVPADPAEEAAWRAVPPPPVAASTLVTAPRLGTMEKLPPGVVEAVKAKAEAAVKAKPAAPAKTPAKPAPKAQ